MSKDIPDRSDVTPRSSRRAWIDRAIFFIVFGLAGPSTAFIGAWIKPWFGLGKGTPLWISILYFILITLPIHQVLVLFYGWLFGRFRFFLDYEKRFFIKIGRFLSGKGLRNKGKSKD